MIVRPVRPTPVTRRPGHATPGRSTRRGVSPGSRRSDAAWRRWPGAGRVDLGVGERVARSRCGRGRSRTRRRSTSPLAVDERAAGVAGRERRREHEHVPPARRRCGRCRCRPRRSPRRCAPARPQRAAAGMAVDRADVADCARRRSAAAAARAREPRAPRGRGPGRTRPRVAGIVRPLRRRRVVACSPATTCALVTTRSGRRDPPLPSWICRTRCPSTFTVDARHARVDRGRQRRRGRRCRVRAATSVPSADGYGASEIARPHAANRAGWSGAHRSIAATIARARAPCAPASPARSRATG